jgi:hypothetical protein
MPGGVGLGAGTGETVARGVPQHAAVGLALALADAACPAVGGA